MLKYYLCPHCKNKEDDPHEVKLVCMSTWDFKNNCEDKDALPIFQCSYCGKKFNEAELKKDGDLIESLESEEEKEDNIER